MAFLSIEELITAYFTRESDAGSVKIAVKDGNFYTLHKADKKYHHWKADAMLMNLTYSLSDALLPVAIAELKRLYQNEYGEDTFTGWHKLHTQ